MTLQFLSDMPPAQNPNTGKSVTIATKAPPELLSAVIEIIERGKSSPYKTVSAFVRAAIHRLVLQLSDADSTLLPPIVVLLKEWSRKYFEFTCYEQVVAGMENNAKMLEKYLEHGEVDRAMETLEDIAADVAGLKDSFWRKMCLRELWKFKAAREALKLAGDGAPVASGIYMEWKEGQE